MSREHEEPGAPANDDLQLSPSERMAHNAALRVAGGRGGRSTVARTQRALASIVLGFELIIVFLMGMTVYGLAILEPASLGIWGGVGLCIIIVIALGTMRVTLSGGSAWPPAMPIGSVGILIGWLVHIVMLLTAILIPLSLIVSVLFSALWVYCMIKGTSIDRGRLRWEAQQSQ